MDDPESVPAVDPVCPWCSAPLTSADLQTCPSCGAHLTGEAEVDVPGVTSLDRETLVRLERAERERAAGASGRRGLLGWIASDDEPAPALDAELASLLAGAKVDPPSEDVRREMLRLEMEALIRDAEAEASHLEAEASALAESTGEAADVAQGSSPDAPGVPDGPAGEADEPA